MLSIFIIEMLSFNFLVTLFQEQEVLLFYFPIVTFCYVFSLVPTKNNIITKKTYFLKFFCSIFPLVHFVTFSLWYLQRTIL